MLKSLISENKRWKAVADSEMDVLLVVQKLFNLIYFRDRSNYVV